MNPSDAITPNHIIVALRGWFDSGHTRFVLALQGERAGKTLLAEPGEGDLRLTERTVISRPDGVILERREAPMSLFKLSRDPVNAPLLLSSLERAMAGEILPPQICSTPAAAALAPAARPKGPR